MHDTLFNLKPGIDSTSSIAESSTTENQQAIKDQWERKSVHPLQDLTRLLYLSFVGKAHTKMAYIRRLSLLNFYRANLTPVESNRARSPI